MTNEIKAGSGKLGNLSADLGLRTESRPVQGGYEALMEDIFGLNVRSLRTIRTLFLAPKAYFDAAKTIDWDVFKFTPSPRLWLGLIALTVATRFIWGAPDSQFMETMSQQAQMGFEAGLGNDVGDVPPIDWTTVIEKSFDIALLVQPVLMLAMMLFLATFIRFWGEPLPYVVRVRYLFAVIIPATVINFGLTFLIIIIPSSMITGVSIAQLVLMFGVYCLTAAQGPFKTHPADSRYPKAIVLSVILFVAVIITNFIAQAIGIFAELVPTLRETIETAKAAAG